jgi:hypothetical protein
VDTHRFLPRRESEAEQIPLPAPIKKPTFVGFFIGKKNNVWDLNG